MFTITIDEELKNLIPPLTGKKTSPLFCEPLTQKEIPCKIQHTEIE
jgi:hypothetical protein